MAARLEIDTPFIVASENSATSSPMLSAAVGTSPAQGIFWAEPLSRQELQTLLGPKLLGELGPQSPRLAVTLAAISRRPRWSGQVTLTTPMPISAVGWSTYKANSIPRRYRPVNLRVEVKHSACDHCQAHPVRNEALAATFDSGSIGLLSTLR